MSSGESEAAMYAALKAVRVAQGAADNEDESDRDGQLDEYEAQPQPSPQLQRKRKEENPEQSPSPEKVSRKEEPQTPFQSLPPRKLNPDGSFGDPKPKHHSSGRIPQPWLCPVAECGRNNFQWRKECPHCGQEKPPGVVSFVEVTPKRAQPQQMDSQEDDNKEETVAVAVKSVEEENNKKIVSAVDPPAEVVRGSKNNANLEGLGQRRGRSRGRGSAGVSMAERLAKMAGMTDVPGGFGKKEEEEKSWADIKNKKIPSVVPGFDNVDGKPHGCEERENNEAIKEGTSHLGRGTFNVGGGGSNRGTLGFEDSFGNFRNSDLSGRGSRGGLGFAGERGGPPARMNGGFAGGRGGPPARMNGGFAGGRGLPPSRMNGGFHRGRGGPLNRMNGGFHRGRGGPPHKMNGGIDGGRAYTGPEGGFGFPGGRAGRGEAGGDWECPNPGCRMTNLCWSSECSQCGAPRPGEGNSYSEADWSRPGPTKPTPPKVSADYQNGKSRYDFAAQSGLRKVSVSGWDSYQKPVVATTAFTPIWPAVPARERESRQTESDDSVLDTIPHNVSPGMRKVMERVMEATTPLSSVSYREQLAKKMRESNSVADQIGSEILAANSSTKNWIDFQTNKFGHCARMDKLKESPVVEGYRNKCEFAVGLNPDNGKLTVGFKLDPRSASPDVGPVEHLRHVPGQMKEVVRRLETFLRSSPYKHFDYQTGTGHWASVVVRITLKPETLINVNFVPQNLTGPELKYIKKGLRNYFEFGGGSQCKVTSLYFSEKSMSGQGSLDNLYGSDSVVETLFDMEFLISPRAYFCINSKGAETLVNTIAVLTNLHRNLTLLDICCGTGAIGLSLSKRVGNVLGVDLAAEAIDDARRNAKVNKIDNAFFVSGPAEDLIPQMIGQATHDEIVALIDPPRAGIAMKAIRQLRASRIKKIVYVSSDPKSSIKNFIDLARPSSTTFFGDPFIPILFQPVDIFPHTSHYMTVVLLCRVAQADLLHPHRANMDQYYGGLPPHTPPDTESHDQPPPPPGTDTDLNNPDLTADQTAWLEQMVKTYGSTFQRERWVQSLVQQNKQQAAPVCPVPAPRPPSPHIPAMPPFPVAPSSQDPAEYSKYKQDYDVYTEWYNKYALFYAAKQDKKNKAKSSAPQVRQDGSKLPDPHDVPAGVDPVAWRKYCNETREYFAKYKTQANMAQQSDYFESRECRTDKIADKILANNKRGISM